MGRQRLTVTTTHLKQGWLRRNGVPESDQTTLYERFIRHGHNLTHMVIITDPVYLSEPMIRTTDFLIATQDDGNWLWPCEYVEEITGRAKGEVPHHLPGENPFLKEMVQRTGVPAAPMRGGPETIYPGVPDAAEGRPGARRQHRRRAAGEPGEEPRHRPARGAAGAGQRLRAGRRRRQRRRCRSGRRAR